VFKIFRSFSGTAILFETASKSAKPLSLTLMMLFMFFTVVASAVFMLEPCASPDCTFKDAYNTGYFLAITLTTVGYGDQIPTHPGARMLAIITMMFGAVFLSMPIAVIGNKFELAYNNFEKKQAHKNPKLALENAKKDYQKRLEQRRHRITSGMFSMLYNFQCVEKIMEKIEKGEVAGGVADAVLREMSIIKEGSSGKQSDGGVPSKYAIKSWGDESKEGKEKPEYRKKEGSRAKVLIGPASEALSQLSRKHHFVSIDIRQLFRTNRVDTALPEHIQELMKKITMSEDELSEDKDGKKKKAIGDGQDYGDDDDEPSHAITQSASNGMQAFDLVSSMAAKHQREAAVKQARQRGSLLDKLWLVLEVHESSRCAYRTYMARWVMLGLSVAVMMLSTWPEFHAYGEDSVYCRRLVVSYCKSIELSTSPNKDKWIAANPGCFPATASSLNVSADKDYRGCMARDTCDFPSVAHNMTCSHGVMFDGCDNHPDACSMRHDFRNSVYINLMNGVTVCERTPCVDNVNVPSWYGGRSSGDYSGVWGIMETGLVFYFVLEYVTRVVVARRPKDFFMKHKANLAFTMLLVLEFVLVITSRKDWKYDAWGFQPFDQTWDTHTMRPLRIIVPLRFVAFSSDFRGIRVAMLTLERVAGRMLTPALFFAVFMVLFAGLMYVFELLECKAMQIPDGRGNLKWFYMNSNEEDDCMVQDMFDAMWIIIVTMTSVGYGGKFPRSSGGKGIAMVSAIFGAFYMAMPLTIIGSTFYTIYIEQEENRTKLQLKMKLRHAAFSLAKKTSFFKADNDHVVLESGYERLCHTLNMRKGHGDIIDKYISVQRDDIHHFDKEDFLKFKQQHLRATETLALYLHAENESEVARQHLHLASKVSGGNMRMQLSAFRQASVHLRDFDELSDPVSPARSEISAAVDNLTPKTLNKVNAQASQGHNYTSKKGSYDI